MNQDMFQNRHQRETGVVLHHHNHDPLVQMVVVESIMSFTKPLKRSGCCCKSALNMFLGCCSSSFAWASETRSSFDLSSFWSVCLLLLRSLLNFPLPYAGLVPNCCLVAWMLPGVGLVDNFWLVVNAPGVWLVSSCCLVVDAFFFLKEMQDC